MKVCIVIPAYNEEKRIIHTLEDFRKTILAKYKDDVEILVVSESTDKTNSIVRDYAFKHKQIRLPQGPVGLQIELCMRSG